MYSFVTQCAKISWSFVSVSFSKRIYSVIINAVFTRRRFNICLLGYCLIVINELQFLKLCVLLSCFCYTSLLLIHTYSATYQYLILPQTWRNVSLLPCYDANPSMTYFPRLSTVVKLNWVSLCVHLLLCSSCRQYVRSLNPMPEFLILSLCTTLSPPWGTLFSLTAFGFLWFYWPHHDSFEQLWFITF